MHVVMVSREYPPVKIGGLSTHVYWVCKKLINFPDMKVTVSHLAEKGQFVFDIIEGVNVRRIDLKRQPKDVTEELALMQAATLQNLLETYDDEGVSLVHCHDYPFAPAVISFHKIRNVPLVFTFHSHLQGRISEISQRFKVYDEMEKWLCREADCVVAVSNYMKDVAVEKYGVEPERVSVIYNGVDVRFWHIPHSKVEKGLILYVGRLSYEKGVDLLIEAFAKIRRRLDYAHLVIAGKGKESIVDFYKRKVMQLDLPEDSVRIMRNVSDDVLRQLYNKCEVYVLPTRYEPFGITILEAMACRKPVVATKVGGIPEIVKSKQNGLLFRLNDVDDLAEKIIKLLCDEKLHSKCSEGAYETAKKFSWEKVAENLLNVYVNLLNG